MAKPSKNIFLIYNTIPQREDIILLYIGYDSNYPQIKYYALVGLGSIRCRVGGATTGLTGGGQQAREIKRV